VVGAVKTYELIEEVIPSDKIDNPIPAFRIFWQVSYGCLSSVRPAKIKATLLKPIRPQT